MAGETAKEASLDGHEVRRVVVVVRKHVGAVRDVVQVIPVAVALPARTGGTRSKGKGKGASVEWAPHQHGVLNHSKLKQPHTAQ